MQRIPETDRRRSSARPRGASLASRRNTNTVSQPQVVEREYVASTCRPRSPARTKSPGRRGQRQRSTSQKNVVTATPLGKSERVPDDGFSSRYEGSDEMERNQPEIPRCALTEQDGTVVTKRTISVDSITNHNSSNILSPANLNNSNLINYPMASGIDKNIGSIPDFSRAVSGFMPLVKGHKDVGTHVRPRGIFQVLLMVAQAIYSVIEMFLLTTIVVLISSYLSFEPCPNHLRDFFWKISDLLFSLLSLGPSYHRAIIIFWSFVGIQLLIHYISAVVLKITAKGRSDELVRTHSSQLGNVNALVSLVFIYFLYMCFPALPSMIVDNVHQLTVVCSTKVFLILLLKTFLDLIRGPNSVTGNEQIMRTRDFLLITFGIVGSLTMVMTYGWSSSFTPIPNYTAVTLAASESAYFVTLFGLKCFIPDINSLLIPKKDSPLFSLLFESLVWLPFGLNTSLRYCSACEREFTRAYLIGFFLTQLAVDLFFICLCFQRAKTAGRKKLLDLLCGSCEMLTIVMWFATMGIQSMFLLVLMTFAYVLVVRSPYLFQDPPARKASKYDVSEAIEAGIVNSVAY